MYKIRHYKIKLFRIDFYFYAVDSGGYTFYKVVSIVLKTFHSILHLCLGFANNIASSVVVNITAHQIDGTSSLHLQEKSKLVVVYHFLTWKLTPEALVTFMST